MTDEASSEPVTWGYLGGCLLALLAFLNLGLVAMLLTPFAVVAHRWAARHSGPCAATHHRFLARTWLWTLLGYVLLYGLLVFPLWQALHVMDVAAQAHAAADPGREWETVISSLFAYLSTYDAWAMGAALMVVVLHGLASILIASWLAVRLIRRWLRWVDRRPA